MWSGAAWMMWPGQGPVPVSPRPSTSDRVLARVRHPSFGPEVADQLVRELSRRQLRRLWVESDRLLGQPLPDDTRLNVVVLRDHLLRQLERLDPSAVLVCDRARPARLGRRRRAARR
jgi:hypothetical protein